MQRCPVSLLPGHVLAARGPCMSSNGLPQHRSSLPKPDLHVPMTHPDRTLNPATCLSPCSLNLCSAPRSKPCEQGNQPHSMASMPTRCELSTYPAHYSRGSQGSLG